MNFSLKNTAASLAALLILVLAFSGCRKWSHNGDIDGQWQVTDVAYSGVSVDFPQGERFYYNFYLNTFQLGFTDARPIWLRGNFVYDKDKQLLSLDFPYVKNGRVPEEWKEKLVYWGVPDSGEMNLKIMQISSSSLVMQYDDVVISCRKF